jgi:hypothetical protein
MPQVIYTTIHPTDGKSFELTRKGAGEVTRNLTVFEIVI